MENSVIVAAPLIPWSIAGAVPLASVSKPLVSNRGGGVPVSASNLASYWRARKAV